MFMKLRPAVLALALLQGSAVAVAPEQIADQVNEASKSLQVIERASDGQVLPARVWAQNDLRPRIAVEDAGASYPIRVDPTFSDADWTSVVTPAINGSVLAMAVGAESLYLGGSFTLGPDGLLPYIARWNGSKWSVLGGGTNGSVYALAWDADNEHLYVGGSFTLAGEIEANHVARWDGNEWTALDSGVNGLVRSLVWDADNGQLYTGGDFSEAGENTVNRVARWDGVAWSALGTGVNNRVYALAWDAQNRHLYAGGMFSAAGGKEASRVALWDGTEWSPLGGGVFDSLAFNAHSRVNALVWDTANSRLFAGGVFSRAGTGIFVRNVAIWDDEVWSEPAGGGLWGGSVYALVLDSDTGLLYAGGSFTIQGASGVASWDGTSWVQIGGGVDGGSVNAMALDSPAGVLHAGGEFTTAGEQAANRLAHWNGNEWRGEFVGIAGRVRALLWDPDNGHLYVGGDTSGNNQLKVAADGKLISGLARWNGSQWSGLGDGPEFLWLASEVTAFAWDSVNEFLYVGMSFNTGTLGIFPDAIARWDGAQWSTLGRGIRGGGYHSVRGLLWDSESGDLFVGGEFGTVDGAWTDGQLAGGIARWDGTTWNTFGNGVSGTAVNIVYALAWDADNRDLYIGGHFTSVSGKQARSIARWDGEEWTALGDGITAGTFKFVRGLAWDQVSSNLYVGGSFSGAGGIDASGIAMWDGSDWNALGDGVHDAGPYAPSVRGLVWDGEKQHLYVGGFFRAAGDGPANYVAYWDGYEWSTLGNGTSWDVDALAWDAANRQLYAGGRFAWAGGQPARIARLETRAQQQPPVAITATPEQIEIGGQSLLTTTGGSGTGAVNHAITSGAEFCAISGNILHGLGIGFCEVTATKDGDSDYRPSSAVVEVTVVGGVFQDRFEEH